MYSSFDCESHTEKIEVLQAFKFHEIKMKILF